MAKSREAFRTISEVAEWLDTKAHVLRFWESKFTQVKPVKRAGGRRYYRPQDMQLLGGIKKLLYDERMTIKGAQKLLREKGVKYVVSLSPPLDGKGNSIVDLKVSDAAKPNKFITEMEPEKNMMHAKTATKSKTQSRSVPEVSTEPPSPLSNPDDEPVQSSQKSDQLEDVNKYSLSKDAAPTFTSRLSKQSMDAEPEVQAEVIASTSSNTNLIDRASIEFVREDFLIHLSNCDSVVIKKHLRAVELTKRLTAICGRFNEIGIG